MWDYTVKVEEARAAGNGKPSAGAVYRSIYAKNELLETPSHMDSPWDFFSKSVKKNSNNQMLGHRQIKNGKAGGYSRLTYQQVYDATLKIGSAIRRRGVNPVMLWEGKWRGKD
ncbi:hypothetical protein OROHE_026977 [Orobanche hederae]